jgi:hypothetical protein
LPFGSGSSGLGLTLRPEFRGKRLKGTANGEPAKRLGGFLKLAAIRRAGQGTFMAGPRPIYRAAVAERTQGDGIGSLDNTKTWRVSS